jgi:hypothetical protein
MFFNNLSHHRQMDSHAGDKVSGGFVVIYQANFAIRQGLKEAYELIIHQLLSEIVSECFC